MDIRFEKNHFFIDSVSRIFYRMDGQLHSLETGGNKNGIQTDLLVSGNDSGKRIEVEVANLSGQPAEIVLIESLQIENWEAFECGLAWQDIQVMIQGRHKNDIPSVVTLGKQDESMEDALDGMTESGIKNQSRKAENGKYVTGDTLTVFRGNKGYLAVEFPRGDRYYCRTAVSLDENGPVISAGCEPGIILQPGETIKAEPLILRTGPDWQPLVRSFAEEKAACLGSRRGYLPVPAVFCTWYYYGLTVSYADVKENLEWISRKKLPYTVFQIDEGWEVTLGEWKPNNRFPVSMKALAKEICSTGMIPGIWTSPFIAHASASIWSIHPEWALRDNTGSPVLFPMNGTVYQVLDITLETVRNYIREFYQTLTNEWGYRYHKLDFTRAPVIYPWAKKGNPALAWPEAYRLALCAVREGIGEDSYLLICGGLYDASVGIADAQRTGSDVLSMWASESGGGKAVPCTVKQNLMRFHMNAWWANDADCLMLRRQRYMTRSLNLTLGLLNDEEVKVMLLSQYLSGGLFSQTEPLKSIDQDRLREIRHLLPLIPLVSEPVLFDNTRIPSRIRVTGKDIHELVLINWDDTESLPITVSASEILNREAEDKQYILSSFYSEKWIITGGCDSFCIGTLPPHSAEIVRAQVYIPGKPFIIGSTGHFALGGELAEICESAETISLIPQKPLPFTTEYRVLLSDGQCRNIRIQGTVSED